MNKRALSIKKQETQLERQRCGSYLAEISARKATLDQKINALNGQKNVLSELANKTLSETSADTLCRRLNYQSWCDQLVEQSEKHLGLLHEQLAVEQLRLERLINHLKLLKRKEDTFADLIKRCLRKEIAASRAVEDSAIEELALGLFLRVATS